VSRISTIVTVLAVLAALFHSGPQQAWACLCSHPAVSEAGTVYADYDALAIVSVEQREASSPILRVGRAFKGVTTDTITFGDQQVISSCDYTPTDVGSKHFVALMASSPGTFNVPHVCVSFPMDDVEGAPSADYRTKFVAAIESEAIDAGTLLVPSAHSSSGPATGAYLFVAASLMSLAGIVIAGRRVGVR
jgi:hypothetical protein